MIVSGSLNSGSFGGMGKHLPAWLLGGSFAAGIEVSVLVSESHNLTSTPTDTAIESGATVSDHVIINPNEVTLAFEMTNTGGGAERAREVLDQFEKMRDERTPMELITEHKLYKNMVVTGIMATHEAPHKGSLKFTVTLRQINFVQLESRGRQPANLSSSNHTNKTASGEVNAGMQEGERISFDKSAGVSVGEVFTKKGYVI